MSNEQLFAGGSIVSVRLSLFRKREVPNRCFGGKKMKVKIAEFEDPFEGS